MSGAADWDGDDGNGRDTCVDGGSVLPVDAFPLEVKTRDGDERDNRVTDGVAAWKLRSATTRRYRAKSA